MRTVRHLVFYKLRCSNLEPGTVVRLNAYAPVCAYVIYHHRKRETMLTITGKVDACADVFPWCSPRLVPSRYLNFNFIGANRYISIYIDQYQRWTRARGKGKAREKITKFSSFALPVSLYTSGRAHALVFKSDWGRV